MSVLALGSGSGNFTIRLSEAVGNEGAVTPWTLMKRADSLGITSIESCVSSAAEIDFIASESMDILFSNGLLCCTLDHKGAE